MPSLWTAVTACRIIQGNVSIGSTKMPDSDTLYVDDSGDPVLHTGKNAVTVTSRSIVGLAPGTISYGPHMLFSLTLQANGMGTIWNIDGTPIPYQYFQGVGGKNKNGGGGVESVVLPTTTTMLCSGQDTVNVGDPSNGLQDIYGTLNIETPAVTAAVAINMDDHETTYGTPCSVSITNANITGNSIIGLGYVVINYGILGPNDNVVAGGVSELTVRAGTGGTTFMFGDMTGGPSTVTLSALGTGNSIDGPNTSVNWTFQGHNSPLDSFTQTPTPTPSPSPSASTVDFTGIEAITGGSGSNDFQFIQTGFNGSIDGGSSGDSTLDFSKYGSLSVETTQDGTLNGVQGYATEGTSFNDIDTLLGDRSYNGDIGNTTAENETYQGNFTHTLTVSGFIQMEFNFAGNFSGELFAQTEGTAALAGTENFPFSTINVTGTIEPGAIIKVGFLLYLDVEGDMDGTVKGFGVVEGNPPIPTIQYVQHIDGTVGTR